MPLSGQDGVLFMASSDVQLVILGVVGLMATAAIFAPVPLGCFGLLIHFASFFALVLAAISATLGTFRTKTSLRRLFVVVFVWGTVFAMLLFFPFALHAVGWFMTR